jgi:glyoxylase-like metal-dependent hydrolase (beta-lactamase superfamily II)
MILEQWLAGRDFARHDRQAAEMVNFVYLIADEEAKAAWLVDPAWSVSELVERVESRGLGLAGVLLTHWHPDHAGGDLLGLAVEGARAIWDRTRVPIRAHREEVPWLERLSDLPGTAVRPFEADAVLSLASVRVRAVHTPGHTPGSTCYLVRGADDPPERPGSLCTGDTLFVGSCGRVDLPGSDPRQMFRSLHERLAALPGETIVLPGHDYGPTPTSTLAEERRTNPYLQPSAISAWLEGAG